MQQSSQLVYYLKKIWPTLYKILNGFLYFCVNLIKSIVSRSLQQIRGM